jgi:hypothetical protein
MSKQRNDEKKGDRNMKPPLKGKRIRISCSALGTPDADGAAVVPTDGRFEFSDLGERTRFVVRGGKWKGRWKDTDFAWVETGTSMETVPEGYGCGATKGDGHGEAPDRYNHYHGRVALPHPDGESLHDVYVIVRRADKPRVVIHLRDDGVGASHGGVAHGDDD